MSIGIKKGINAHYTFPFELKNGSTYYVKLHMNKRGTEALLEPQKGRFGKTTEGYSLKKNIRLPKGKNSLVEKEKKFGKIKNCR